jgi:signal transduction histidine kinase
MACNLHGYWSKVPAEFPFALAPHFYETWPFLVLCAGAVVAGVGGWHFRRLRRRRRMLHLRQQQALEEERSRIAKDLHDDLGANFTGLALQLDVARRAQADPTALMQHLEVIAQSIRTLVDRMREVVWTVNPHCDTLESFSAYLCQYAETFLAAAGLRCRLDLPADLPAHALSAEARHHLLMVAKEALNNAAKHAVATEVRLGLNLAGGDLLLTIADNGRGFAPRPHADAGAASRTSNAHGTGHGLANIRRRVEVLGGGVEIEGKLGLGTKILVRVPLQRERRHLKP